MIRLATVCVLLAACVASADLPSNSAEGTGALSFLVVGDWGGKPTSPYTTAAEVAVSKAMARVAAANQSSLVFAVGDNFYDDGVKSVHDQRFQATFENVFTDPALQIPWWIVAGNHDHNGNVSAQIAYSSVSSRWHFPSEYYTMRQTIQDSQGSFTVLFVMIDTVQIDQGDPTQVAWIQQQLEASVSDGSDWVIVMGHYPYYSVAEHGSTPSLQTALSPLLEKYQVAAYMCGHDHDLQHINVTGMHTQFFLSGAGHDLENNHDHAGTVPDGALNFYYPTSEVTESTKHGGFISVHMWRDTMQVDYFNEQAQLLYTAEHYNPRGSSLHSNVNGVF